MDQRADQFLARLSTADRKLLQLSVHMNPIIVSNADGKCSMRESAAMAEAVRKLMCDEAYRSLLLVAGHEEFSDAALRVMIEQHSKDLDGYLAQVAGILDRIPEGVASAYRRFTLFAILHVAEASRDGLFGLLGAKISESEKLMIRKMVAVLGLELEEGDRARLSE